MLVHPHLTLQSSIVESSNNNTNKEQTQKQIHK